MQGFFMQLAIGVKLFSNPMFRNSMPSLIEIGCGLCKGRGGTSSLKVWKHVEPTIATHSHCNHFHHQCHDIKPSAKAELIKESLKVGAHTTIDSLSTYWLDQATMGLWRRFSANSILQNANELQYHEGGFSTP